MHGRQCSGEEQKARPTFEGTFIGLLNVPYCNNMESKGRRTLKREGLRIIEQETYVDQVVPRIWKCCM